MYHANLGHPVNLRIWSLRQPRKCPRGDRENEGSSIPHPANSTVNISGMNIKLKSVVDEASLISVNIC